MDASKTIVDLQGLLQVTGLGSVAELYDYMNQLKRPEGVNSTIPPNQNEKSDKTKQCSDSNNSRSINSSDDNDSSLPSSKSQVGPDMEETTLEGNNDKIPLYINENSDNKSRM